MPAQEQCLWVTDRLDMTLALDRAVKPQHKQTVWTNIWPQNKCRSVWPIFHGSVMLPYILKTFWCMNIINWDYELSGIMSPYDTKFDLKIQFCHCDLYFVVQCFCILSCRLFVVWTSYFRIMGYDLMFDRQTNIGYCDLYFMVQGFRYIFRNWSEKSCRPAFLAQLSRRLNGELIV